MDRTHAPTCCCRFLTERGFKADVAACHLEFPGLLTFDQFLKESNWGDAARTYEQVGLQSSSGWRRTIPEHLPTCMHYLLRLRTIACVRHDVTSFMVMGLVCGPACVPPCSKGLCGLACATTGTVHLLRP